MNTLLELTEQLENVVLNMGVYAPFLSILLIIAESFLPFLPLVVFISSNLILLGWLFGFIVSYIAAIMGSYLAFLFTRKFLSNLFSKKLKRSHDYINKLNFVQLTLLLSLPFAPSSIINFMAGIGVIKKQNYFISLCISKFFIVLWWGMIGVSIYENLFTSLNKIIIVLLIMIIVYFVSKKIEKIIEKRNLNE